MAGGSIGRVAIEGAHRVIFDGIYKGSRNRYAVRGIRFPRPDVAIVLMEAHLQFSEHGQAPRNPRATDPDRGEGGGAVGD
jgi:hypothetical protein